MSFLFVSLPASAPDTLVEPHVQQRPHQYVGDEHQRVVHAVGSQQVEDTEAGRHQQDGHHRRTGREAHRQELVVDVRLVRQEGILAVADPPQHHADHVQRGDEQHAEGNQHRGTGYLVGSGTRIHAVFHREQAQQVAQQQAARVAHENLPAPGGVPENVVGEKGNQHADAHKSHQGVDPPAAVDEHTAEHGQGDHAQTGGEAVDAVDQVDGVGDEDHQHQRQRDAEPGSDGVDAEQAVEVVDVQPRKGKHQGGQKLDHELLAVADTYQVVGNAHYVEQRQARGEQQQLGRHAGKEQAVRGTVQQQAQGDEQAHAEQDDREEAYAPQTGDQVTVNLAGIGHVEQTLAERDQQDVRNDDLAQDDCHRQGGYDKSEILPEYRIHVKKMLWGN